MQLKCAGCARTKLLLATSEICNVGGQESDVKDVESYSTAPPPPVTPAGSVCQFKFKWPALPLWPPMFTSVGPDAAWPSLGAGARGLGGGGRRGLTGASHFRGSSSSNVTTLSDRYFIEKKEIKLA